MQKHENQVLSIGVIERVSLFHEGQGLFFVVEHKVASYVCLHTSGKVVDVRVHLNLWQLFMFLVVVKVDHFVD